MSKVLSSPSPAKGVEVVTSSDLLDWDRSSSRRFVFVSRTLSADHASVELVYELDGIRLVEKLEFPAVQVSISARRIPAIERALDLLHWVAGVSYWKAGCPLDVGFGSRSPDGWQAAWLNRLYREGLAEFAYCNGLNRDHWSRIFSADSGSDPDAELDRTTPERSGLARRTLLPLGGGKDSLVAWSRLVRTGDQPDTVQIGSSPVIERIGRSLEGDHWMVRRALDPRLQDLNRAGAWNGHVPVTAINAAICVLAALLMDYDRVVFANERSANEASLEDASGNPVNHQFSKSLEFEVMLDEWVGRYIEPDLKVFSILRQDRELAICREFADQTRFHPLFASCNRNFHLDGPRIDRWCGRCPKCLFVFLGLAPFMSPASLSAIFGRDLLEDSDLTEGFAQLLALDGVKPLECVGEAEEARAAVKALAGKTQWMDHDVVQALSSRLAGIHVSDLEEVCRPGGRHLIPPECLHAA